MRRNKKKYRKIALFCALTMVVSAVEMPVPFVNAETPENVALENLTTEGDNSISGGDIQAAGITIPSSLELVLDTQDVSRGTAVLQAVFEPDNTTDRTLQWFSDNPGIVEVAAGESDTGAMNITAKAVGNAVITAALKTDESKKAECSVTVKSVPVSVDTITLNDSSDGQGNRLSADNIMATQKVFYLFADLKPEAQCCTDSSIVWSVEGGKSFVALDGNCVRILDLPNDENQVTFNAETVNGCTGTVTVTIKKVQPEMKFEQQEPIEYGRDNVCIAAGVYDGNVPLTANLSYELVTGEGLLNADEISIDRMTGRVIPHKMGNFKVRVSFDGDGTYQAVSAEKEFQVSRKTLNVVLTDSGAIIQKVSDGTTGLTADNVEQIKSLIQLEEGQVLAGDTVELVVTVPDTTQYDNLDAYTGDGDSGNSVALTDVQITMKTDDGKYRLDPSAVNNASLTARIIPIAVQDNEFDLIEHGTDVSIHGQKIIVKGGTLGRDGKYWYGKNGVPVEVMDSGVSLYRWRFGIGNALSTKDDGKTYLAVNSGSKVYVAENNTSYGDYKFFYQTDTTAPVITMTAAKTEDGVSAGGMVFDKKVVYTIEVTDVGSGIPEKGKEGIVYGFSGTNDASGVTAWKEPDSLEERKGTQGGRIYTFRVETPNSGCLFVKAKDCVGNTTTSQAIRSIILESDEPSVSLECDNTEYRRTHTVSVTAKDAEEAGNSPYSYSGIARVDYVLAQDGHVVFQATENNGDVPENMSQIPQKRVFTHRLEDLQKGNVGIYDGQDLNGSYQLTVTAYDNCGNSSSASGVLYFDNAAPDCFISMENGMEDTEGNYYYRADNCGIRVKVEDARIAEGVTYQITVGGNRIADGTLTENAEITLTKEEISRLADGKVQVGVTLTDKAGNVSNRFTEVSNMNCNTDKTEASFILDTKAPVAKVEMTGGNALDNTYYYRADNCGIVVAFEDNVGENAPARGGLAQYKASVSRQDGTELELSLEDGESEIRLDADAVKECGDGNRTITVTATDVAGNVMTSLLTLREGGQGVVIEQNNASFVLDTVAPRLTSVSLKETDGEKNGVNYYSNEPLNVYVNGSYTVTYTVEEDNYLNDENHVTMNAGETVTEGERADCHFDAADKAAITLSVSTGGKQIENARYCPTLTVTDKAGNVLVKDVSFDNGGYDYNNVTVDNDGKAAMEVCQVLDNVAPVLDSVKVVKHTGTVIPDYTDAVYVNGAFSVTYHVTEQNYSNANDLVVFGADGSHSIHPSFVSQDKEAITMRVEPGDNQNIEGDIFIPYLQVTDKAGNRMILSDEFDDDGKEYNRVTVTEGMAVMDRQQILDTKAPVVTINYTEPGNSHYYEEPDGTYAYYNQKYQSLTASYCVEEKNFDSSKIWIGYSEDGGEIAYREVKANANQTNSPDTLSIPITEVK